MDIIAFSFGRIYPHTFEGMSNIFVPLFERMVNDSVIRIQFYVPRCRGYSGTVNVKAISPVYVQLRKVLSVVASILRIPSWVLRDVNIRMFDLFAKQKIKKGHILIFSLLLPKTMKKNKRFGGKNYLIMGNPDYEHVYKIMCDLQNRYNISIKDAYTYKPTLNKWRSSMPLFNKIICGSKTMADTFYLSKDVQLSYPLKITLSPQTPLSEETMHIHCSYLAEKENNAPVRFCYIGHTVWLKGLHDLLEAWERLEQSTAELYIAGGINKGYKSWIDNRFSQVKNVFYLGFVPSLDEFYYDKDVFICPSLSDAGPATIVEALSVGLPIIASDGCGYSELIEDDYNGYVFQKGNVEDLIRCLNIFIFKNNTIKKMSDNARESVMSIVNDSMDEYIGFIREQLLD